MKTQKRVTTGLKISKKTNRKSSLNIKINAELDEKLKKARHVARQNGGTFNVSENVEDFLEKLIVAFENQMEVKLDDVDLPEKVEK